MASTPQTKRLAIKGATIDGNTLLGNAAGIGNLDRGADVICPGFFAGVLDAFLQDGFSPTDHAWDWKSLVAMPKVAKEQGQFLYTESVFHGTPDAQEVKQKCQERLDAGLSVGLSIGFSLDADGFQWFKNGPELLDWAKKNGYDLKLFDVKGIQAWNASCRALIKCAELFEYSIVCVPMNPAATATGVKRFATPEELGSVLADILSSGAEILLPDGTRLVPSGAGDGGEDNKRAPHTMNILESQLKSQYLGENIEVHMTMDAVYELTWSLYTVISQQLFGSWAWDDDEDDYLRVAPPLDDALTTIRLAAGEFSAILLAVIEAIMRCTEGAQDVADAEKSLTALTGANFSLSETLLRDDLPAGKSFKTQLTTALAAVKGCTERARAIAGLRRKEGRVLSQDNRDKLAAHRDALQACVDTIDEVLEASQPKARPDALRKARVAALLREAAPFLALDADAA